MWAIDCEEYTYMVLPMRFFKESSFVDLNLEGANTAKHLCKRFNAWARTVSETKESESDSEDYSDSDGKVPKSADGGGNEEEGAISGEEEGEEQVKEIIKLEESGDVVEVNINNIERAPDEYQARPLERKFIEELKKSMISKPITYKQNQRPLYVFEKKKEPGKYCVFDGNHNFQAQLEVYKKDQTPEWATVMCKVIEKVTPRNAIILGIRQNEENKDFLPMNDMVFIESLRTEAKRLTKNANPPIMGKGQALAPFHYQLLRVDRMDYNVSFYNLFTKDTFFGLKPLICVLWIYLGIIAIKNLGILFAI